MSTTHDEDAIRTLAYYVWEERGRQEGSAERDWAEAQRRAGSHSVDKSSKESFPASDPPGSHFPDEPPANAAQKFAAADAHVDAHPGQPVIPVLEPVRELNPRLDSALAQMTAPQRNGAAAIAYPPKVASQDAPGG